MKINQFALKQTDLKTATKELEAVYFLDVKAPKEATELWFYLLEKSLVLVKDQGSIKQKLQNLLATRKWDLEEFRLRKAELTKDVFYTVGLQLLGFQEGLDFTIEDQADFLEKSKLPVYEGDYAKSETVIQSWYLLLSTRGKYGVTLLDHLANQGYFNRQQNVPKPLFFNGKAQAVFDTSRLIREVVYVESDLDTDEDGKRDLLKLEIIRPSETNEGLKVPVLFTASPYYQGINPEASEAMNHEVDLPLTRKEPNQITYEEIRYKGKETPLPPARTPAGKATEATETAIGEVSISLNDYFLSRGFGVVYGSGIGTRDSDGIQTCGSVEQTDSFVAYIEWLAGNRRAFTNKVDNIEIKAWWCNGKVAMTGRSYLGTLATAAATTGVEGLETIISEAAISDWYQYYRDNGLVIAPEACQGEDADVLAELTLSRMHDAGDYLKIKDFFNQKQKEMAKLQDRVTGDYTTFWDERNYLPNVDKIKADIVMVHGLNDWNVKPRHVYQLWNALKEIPVQKKMILHQGEHIYINDLLSLDFHEQMNLWLSYKLYGLENDAKTILPDVIYQDNIQEETWHELKDWQSETWQTYHLGQDSLTEEACDKQISFNDQLPTNDFEKYKKDTDVWENDLKTADSPLAGHRYLAKTQLFSKELILKGAPKVKIKVASSENIGMLSFQLVDYGSAQRLKKTPEVLAASGIELGYQWRRLDLLEFKKDQPTPFKMITKGHINLQNRHTPWQTDDLKPTEFVEIEVELQPTIYHVAEGHQLGLIVYSTDFGMTFRGNQAIEYTLDLVSSVLELPIEK